MNFTTKRVLALIFDGVEELELVAPVDLLRRAEIHVTIASLSSLTITGRNGIKLLADAPLDAVDDSQYDALLIPGGPGIHAVRSMGSAARLAEDFFQRGKLIAAICAAPLVLHDAKLLENRRFCAHGSTHEALPAAILAPVIVDGQIITSMGAGTAIAFGLALIENLLGREPALQVADSIHFSSKTF